MPEDDEIVTVALDSKAWIRVTVLISFAVSVLVILGYLLSGGGRELFQHKVLLRTYFPDGGGLERKAVVELDGIKIGHIESVELSHSDEPSRVVRVNFTIDRRYLNTIPVDSRTELTETNLLGDKYINIHRGTAGEFLKAGDELFASPPSNGFDPSNLILSLQQTLKQAETMLDAIDYPTSPVGQLVQGEALYDKFRDDIVGIQKALHQIGNPKSPAGQAIFGTELYEQMLAPLVDIDKQLAAIQNGEGDLGHAFATSEQYDKLRAQAADFRKSMADFRKSEFLTSDEKYYAAVRVSREFSAMVTTLSNGPLFENAQLYESLNGSASSAGKFLKEFRQNPQKFLRIKVF